MSVRIRLQPRGKKNQKHYLIVVTDSRCPRNGKFIENLGFYKTHTTPSTYEIDSERSLYWLKNGAQPTDTVKSILQKSGVFYKKHLLEGVAKGAFIEYEAEIRFNEWYSRKQENAIDAKQFWDKKKTLEKLIRQGTIPHFKENKIEFERTNTVPRLFSISDLGEGQFIQDKDYQRTIIKEYIEIKIKNNMNNLLNCTLSIELLINNKEENILYLGNEYQLNIKVRINNAQYDKDLSNQIKVLCNPHLMEVLDNSIKKISFNRKNLGCSHFKFRPTSLGSKKMEIEFLQNLDTVKSIPLEFQIVET